jgi:hypothetical protein
VITGCSNGEGSPSGGAYGDIRGWDAKTGKLLWTFHTVPRPGETGSETWPSDSWKNRSGTNAWGFFTIDIKRGIVYAPLGSPTSDFYGADRVGDGLYGDVLQMGYFKQERFDLFRTEHGFYRGLNDPGTLERAKETAFATHPDGMRMTAANLHKTEMPRCVGEAADLVGGLGDDACFAELVDVLHDDSFRP